MFGSNSSSSGGGGGDDMNNNNNNEVLTRLQHIMMNIPAPQPQQPQPVIGGGVVETDEFSRRDERMLTWSHKETVDLIGIRGELEREFTVAKRNKGLWEVVSVRMKELGYRRTPEQCKCKWKNLVTRYKVNCLFI